MPITMENTFVWVGTVGRDKHSKHSEPGDICAICHEPYLPKQDVLKFSCCSLVSHLDCMKDWADTYQSGTIRIRPGRPSPFFSCPQCRAEYDRCCFWELVAIYLDCAICQKHEQIDELCRKRGRVKLRIAEIMYDVSNGSTGGFLRSRQHVEWGRNALERRDVYERANITALAFSTDAMNTPAMDIPVVVGVDLSSGCEVSD